VTFAGAEASVAVSIRMMGRPSRFVTALPTNDLGSACLDSVRRFDVDCDHIVRGEGRLGLYFLETGANQRPSAVIYDREGSLISRTPADAYDWDGIFKGAGRMHLSGITPAISRVAADASLAAVKTAKGKGVLVSCDLNYRKKLWRWDPDSSPKVLAQKTMRKILPYVDLVIGNEEDASDILGIKAGETDVERGRLLIDRYPEVAAEIVRQFPAVSMVAFTLRESLSASHNNWGAMLFEARDEKSYFAPMHEDRYAPYQIKNIIDRVGGGDAFSAGLLFALQDDEFRDDPQAALSYAVAASCLCHSIKGDFNYTSRDEVVALMKGNASGRVKR
jgi:2-dehydro-3-deoxygluconokinase